MHQGVGSSSLSSITPSYGIMASYDLELPIRHSTSSRRGKISDGVVATEMAPSSRPPRSRSG